VSSSTRAEPGDVALRGIRHQWPGQRGVATLALDDVTLEVRAGEVVALVGPSGCGKSTLLRMLAGLTVPTSGSVEVGGRSVVGRPGACGWMPQNYGLLPWRRVLANATLGADVAGGGSWAARRQLRARAETRARPLLAQFGLGGFEDSWPSQLSGGMRQRLAVLRTVLAEAPVMLLDEPFGSLDALTRRSLQSWFQDVLFAEGPRAAGDSTMPGVPDSGRVPRTVIVVTHDVEEAILLADRVVVLSDRPGRVVDDVKVGLARPRLAHLVSDPTVVSLRAQLLDALGDR